MAPPPVCVLRTGRPSAEVAEPTPPKELRLRRLDAPEPLWRRCEPQYAAADRAGRHTQYGRTPARRTPPAGGRRRGRAPLRSAGTSDFRPVCSSLTACQALWGSRGRSARYTDVVLPPCARLGRYPTAFATDRAARKRPNRLPKTRWTSSVIVTLLCPRTTQGCFLERLCTARSWKSQACTRRNKNLYLRGFVSP